MKDGGPAFSQSFATADDGSMYSACDKDPIYAGMSLRDWLAGQAMVGIRAYGGTAIGSSEWVATRAYMDADAMLKAREKP